MNLKIKNDMKKLKNIDFDKTRELFLKKYFTSNDELKNLVKSAQKLEKALKIIENDPLLEDDYDYLYDSLCATKLSIYELISE